jgi:hypothetical protein
MQTIPGLTQLIDDIADCDEIRIIDRVKNRETRYRLGMTTLDQEDLIKSLTINDYHDGPLTDHDPNYPGNLFIFKKPFQNQTLYIKIKEMEIINDDKVIKCISCHIDYT